MSQAAMLFRNVHSQFRMNTKIRGMIMQQQWRPFQEFGFDISGRWYEHFVTKEKKVQENDYVRILWEFTKNDYNKPDIVVILKKEKHFALDVACHTDKRIKDRENRKRTLERWQTCNTSADNYQSTGMSNYLSKTISPKLETARIIRKVMDTTWSCGKQFYRQKLLKY